MNVFIICILSVLFLTLFRAAAVWFISNKIYAEGYEEIFTDNSEDSVEFAVRSALFGSGIGEITVHDNGSVDGTIRILEMLGRKHHNVHIKTDGAKPHRL